MRQQSATSLVPRPIAEVERTLCDVEFWPQFLTGVTNVTKTAHERYLFTLDSRFAHRDVPTAVHHNGRAHRFSWRSLAGPTFAGTLELTPVDGAHTAVHLDLTQHPYGMAEGLAEMVMPLTSRAALDLDELARALAVRQVTVTAGE